MKALVKIFTIFIFLTFCTLNVNALTFKEGMDLSIKKPMVVLIYADWAENYQDYLTVYKNIQTDFEDEYNFVELNIASKDTYDFNTKYHIYPNLPYILMYKQGGKISRYIPRDCAKDEACTKMKLKSFIQ